MRKYFGKFDLEKNYTRYYSYKKLKTQHIKLKGFFFKIYNFSDCNRVCVLVQQLLKKGNYEYAFKTVRLVARILHKTESVARSQLGGLFYILNGIRKVEVSMELMAVKKNGRVRYKKVRSLGLQKRSSKAIQALLKLCREVAVKTRQPLLDVLVEEFRDIWIGQSKILRSSLGVMHECVEVKFLYRFGGYKGHFVSKRLLFFRGNFSRFKYKRTRLYFNLFRQKVVFFCFISSFFYFCCDNIFVNFLFRKKKRFNIYFISLRRFFLRVLKKCLHFSVTRIRPNFLKICSPYDSGSYPGVSLFGFVGYSIYILARMTFFVHFFTNFNFFFDYKRLNKLFLFINFKVGIFINFFKRCFFFKFSVVKFLLKSAFNCFCLNLKLVKKSVFTITKKLLFYLGRLILFKQGVVKFFNKKHKRCITNFVNCIFYPKRFIFFCVFLGYLNFFTLYYSCVNRLLISFCSNFIFSCRTVLQKYVSIGRITTWANFTLHRSYLFVCLFMLLLSLYKVLKIEHFSIFYLNSNFDYYFFKCSQFFFMRRLSKKKFPVLFTGVDYSINRESTLHFETSYLFGLKGDTNSSVLKQDRKSVVKNRFFLGKLKRIKRVQRFLKLFRKNKIRFKC